MTIPVEQIEQLSDQQRQLLSRWLAEREVASQETSRQQLYAYVTQASHAELDLVQIKQFLRNRLPTYMVPETIVTLDQLPRLANGKVDRHRLPLPTRTRTNAPPPTESQNPIEVTLLEIWSELLSVEILDVHDNFFEFGGDSIVSIQVISRAREAGLTIEPRQIAEYPTIAELAGVVTRQTKHPTDTGAKWGESKPLPIQSWFLERTLTKPAHWNQARLFVLDPSITAAILQRAIHLCISKHDALRAHFIHRSDAWVLNIPNPNDTTIALQTLPVSDSQDLDSILGPLQSEFNLDGPLIRFVLIPSETNDNKLAIIAHHLVVDQVSWMILLENLNATCRQLRDKQSPAPVSNSTTILEWSHQLVKFSQSQNALESMSYWTNSQAATSIPCDFTVTQTVTESSTVSLTCDLSERDTTTLLKCNETYRTTTQDLLLTALAKTLCGWMQEQRICIDLEGHGREDIRQGRDASSTIGWLTSFFPLRLDLSHADHEGEAIKAVKEQRANVPHRGLSYGVLRYLSTDESVKNKLAARPAADVLFNFSGIQAEQSEDSLIRWSRSLDADARAPENARSHLLEANAVIINGQLQVAFMFSTDVHKRDTIRSLADSFLDYLRSLIQHCQNPEAGGYTPSDFPDAGLSQSELDELLEGLD